MRLGDIIKWQPPRFPMEQIRSVTEVNNVELVIVTTMAVYKVEDDPDTEFRVMQISRL